MIVSYADESGMHTNERSPFVSIAGYWTRKEIWKDFTPDWKRELGKYGLETFHMTEFLRRKDLPFSRWSNTEYKECIASFTRVISKWQLNGLAVVVSRSDYDTCLSEKMKKKFTKDPYILLFDFFITKMLGRVYLLPDSEKLAMYFDRTSFKPKAAVVYQRRMNNDPNGHRLVNSPCFVSSHEFPPIQAADILAYLTRNFVRGSVASEVNTEYLNKYLIQLTKAQRVSVCVLEKDDLERAEQKFSFLLKT